MITLYGFGPAFGLPDPSPFVVKAEVLLKMAGIDYRRGRGDRNKAPKSKIPYIDDVGTKIGDSTFIRWHLEQKHGIDFDKGLTAEQRGIAWAVEKMCEDHLYWAVVDQRWMVDENFDKGPRTFFDPLPAPLRPLITNKVRRKVKRDLYGQGFGRHTRDEIEALAIRDIEALAAILADKTFLFGPEPCGADATVFGFLSSALCDRFDGPIGSAAGRHTNLVAYRDRGLQRWYPEPANGKPRT
jgi:glutathione S-transferase